MLSYFPVIRTLTIRKLLAFRHGHTKCNSAGLCDGDGTDVIEGYCVGVQIAYTKRPLDDAGAYRCSFLDDIKQSLMALNKTTCASLTCVDS